MKMKKRLSLLAAASIAASAFAGLAVTSSAAELTELTPIPNTVTVVQAGDYTATTGAQDLTPDGYFIGGKSGILMGTKKYTYDGENANRPAFDIKSATADITQAKVIAFKPSAACTITAYGQYDSGKTNGRGFNIVTDAATGTSTETDGTNIATVEYNGSGYVYLTSTDASVDAYVGTLTFAWNSTDPAATATPEATETPAEPTAAPAELKAVEDTTTWTQADFEIGAYTSAQLSKNADLQINGEDGKAINVDKNAIKLGGTGSAESRNVKFIPAADGTVKVTAVNGNVSATDRFFKIENAGTVTESDVIELDNSVELTVNVKANEPVFIYSGKSGVNLTEIVYTKGAAVEPPAPVVYTITLVDGETSTPTEVEENGTFTFPAPAERVGATFDGWQADGSTELKQEGDEITVTGDVTYTAQWTPIVAPVVDPTIEVTKVGTFTEDDGNAAAAFKGDVTAGTYTITGLTWIAKAADVQSDPETFEVNIATDTSVVYGLVVEAESVAVEDITAELTALFTAVE